MAPTILCFPTPSPAAPMPSSVRSRILSAIFLFVASSSSLLCPIQRSISQCSLRATASQGRRSQESPLLQAGDGVSLPGPSSQRGLSHTAPKKGFHTPQKAGETAEHTHCPPLLLPRCLPLPLHCLMRLLVLHLYSRHSSL